MGFQEKFSNLTKELDKLRKKNSELNATILKQAEEIEKLDALRQKIKDLQGENAILQKDYQILKTARAFGQSEQDKKDAYRRLSNMITEIDKCLDLLNE
jgi:uncharacterized coiled-coil DUF342 family protein